MNPAALILEFAGQSALSALASPEIKTFALARLEVGTLRAGAALSGTLASGFEYLASSLRRQERGLRQRAQDLERGHPPDESLSSLILRCW